jgi:predicted ribosome quality control (RQC) complex YloA/Tae2 family protein
VPLDLPASPAESSLSAPRMLAADEGAALAARKAALLKSLRARLKKLQKTIGAVDADLARANRADEDRHRAELLLPHQARIARGAREAVVPDWSRLDGEGLPAQVTIALDPALGAAQNAARWLKRAHRYRAAVPRIGARRAELDRAAAAIHELEARVVAADDKAALRAAEEEARALGGDLPEQRAPGRRQKAPEKVPFRAFRSRSGARILVGRNARANDELTLKWARGNDLWLHARGLQGSHVVVPEPGDAPDSRTLADAALLAAHFSSARGSEGAEVAWTRRKHVRKARGAAAGAVSYSQEKTMRVRLDPDRLQELLATEGR